MTRPTVVLVDDNAQAAQRLAARFEDAGWSVQVSDGRGALDLFARAEHDLVVADLQLVSIEVGRLIDAVAASDPDVPVIVMSSFAALDEAIKTLYRGAHAYVVKPVRFDELSLLATRAIEQLAIRRDCRRYRQRESDFLVPLREVEALHIRRVLSHCNGNKTRAAEILGIDASTLHRKLGKGV